MNNTLQTKYLVNYMFIPNGNKSNNLQLQATSMEICSKTKYNLNDVDFVYKSNPPFNKYPYLEFCYFLFVL